MSVISELGMTSDDPLDLDRELIASIQKNPALFSKLYDQWATRIFQYFFHRTGHQESAEDLTAQLFLSVYQALPRYHHRGHFPAWLFTIARNLLKEHYRRSRPDAPLEAVEQFPAASDPPGEVAAMEEIHRLRGLIQTLGEEDQELIRLRYVADLTFADMAAVLDKREDAVKKALYRLQTNLKLQMELSHD